MLELRVSEDEVFAFYRPPDAGPNVGGYFGRVYPGGQFKGLPFDRLRALGTGRHEAEADERAGSDRGPEPAGRTEAVRRMEDFRYALFLYTVGAARDWEVLAFARRVVELDLADRPPSGG